LKHPLPAASLITEAGRERKQQANKRENGLRLQCRWLSRPTAIRASAG